MSMTITPLDLVAQVGKNSVVSRWGLGCTGGLRVYEPTQRIGVHSKRAASGHPSETYDKDGHAS